MEPGRPARLTVSGCRAATAAATVVPTGTRGRASSPYGVRRSHAERAGDIEPPQPSDPILRRSPIQPLPPAVEREDNREPGPDQQRREKTTSNGRND